ncbi:MULTISPECIES: fimbrial protein [Achromobacter]|uniref:fimbrial protein n=1 Tax=Achromobacter TaxID=222 RepID=UPI00067D53E1|nr:fimbrial protein [Achromobacter spanius]AZS77323.1 type 1 fimbrial protein [Achromobacter spanius]MCD0498949.1 type 1 fimbrial protein [Achromobacter sp. MY14]MCW3151606.1 type 1 fimbrial protein [Achromobacter spanius]
MNKKIVAASLAFSSLLLCGSAMAADVKLVFTGKVSPSTCKIADLGEQGVFQVDLTTVSVSALAKQNDVAGRKLVALDLTGCSGSKVTTRFNSGSSVDPSTGALINQATPGGGETPSNAQVQLLNSKYQPIHLSNGAGTETVSIEGNAAKIEFYAQYLAATANTTPGPVQTEVLLDLIYE